MQATSVMTMEGASTILRHVICRFEIDLVAGNVIRNSSGKHISTGNSGIQLELKIIFPTKTHEVWKIDSELFRDISKNFHPARWFWGYAVCHYEILGDSTW